MEPFRWTVFTAICVSWIFIKETKADSYDHGRDHHRHHRNRESHNSAALVTIIVLLTFLILILIYYCLQASARIRNHHPNCPARRRRIRSTRWRFNGFSTAVDECEFCNMAYQQLSSTYGSNAVTNPIVNTNPNTAMANQVTAPPEYNLLFPQKPIDQM